MATQPSLMPLLWQAREKAGAAEVMSCIRIGHGYIKPLDLHDKAAGGIVPGCGCSQDLVQEIVRELNLRKDGRGKTAQRRQQDFMLQKLSKLSVQFPLLLKHFQVDYPPDQATLQRIFGAQAAPPSFRPLAEVASVEQLPDFGRSSYDPRTNSPGHIP
eukprot:Skav226375  [mRNA]  locus=scaffold290:275796:288662:- [translate_table: standard]